MENLEQGSKTWLEWRKEGIGSSDAPAILGVSPWRTPLQLYQEKISDENTEVKPGTNWAIDRGNRLEPVARSAYELEHGYDMDPFLAMHDEYKFIRASLDGLNLDQRLVLEIKCPGKEDHEKAVKGEVPLKYMPQLQHQLMVLGDKVDAVHYFSYHDKLGTALVVVPHDLKYQKALLAAERQFWRQVETRDPPGLEKDDVFELSDPESVKSFSQLRLLKKRMVDTEGDYLALKKRLEKNLPHTKCECLGVRVTKVHNGYRWIFEP